MLHFDQVLFGDRSPSLGLKGLIHKLKAGPGELQVPSSPLLSPLPLVQRMPLFFFLYDHHIFGLKVFMSLIHRLSSDPCRHLAWHQSLKGKEQINTNIWIWGLEAPLKNLVLSRPSSDFLGMYLLTG